MNKKLMKAETDRTQLHLRKLEEALQQGLVRSGPVSVASLDSMTSGHSSGLKLEGSFDTDNVSPLPKK